MCVEHWSLVPSAVQTAVWKYFRTERGEPAHVAACAQAVRCVEDTLFHERQIETARRHGLTVEPESK